MSAGNKRALLCRTKIKHKITNYFQMRKYKKTLYSTS